MEINIPIIPEVEKSAPYLQPRDSKEQLNQQVVSFDKKTSSWKIAGDGKNHVSIDCLHVTGGDL